MASFVEVLMPVVKQTHLKRRTLDALYGPYAQSLRLEMVRIMTGNPNVKKSDKRVQWGNFRRSLLELGGITGTCIADEDAKFEEMVERVFAVIVPDLPLCCPDCKSTIYQESVYDIDNGLPYHTGMVECGICRKSYSIKD